MLAKLAKTVSLNLLALIFHKLAHTSTKDNPLEVERKFSIDGDETDKIVSTLTGLSFSLSEQEIMTDIFLPSPKEGEMMRVRQIVPEKTPQARKRVFITSKKWINMANGSKERQEAEREIASTTAAFLVVAGRLINRHPLLHYNKQRLIYHGNYGGFNCHVSLDNASGLGSYSGHYLEIEILVPAGKDPSSAQEAVISLSQKILPNPRPITMSYKDMLTASTC